MPKRLFLPLKTEYYRGFESGLKEWELRGINNQFNRQTASEGREVELRRGYSTDDSLNGIIEEVKTFPELESVISEIEIEKISPNASKKEFLKNAADMLGKYDEYIVFKIKINKSG